MPLNLKQIINSWQQFRKSLGWNKLAFLPFLLLAALFWLSTELSNELQYRKAVYLVFKPSEEMVITTDLPDKLIANVQGEGWDLIFMNDFGREDPLTIHVSPGNTFIDKSELIGQLNITLADLNIQVLDVDFGGKSISQERKISKKMPVSFNGQLHFESLYKLMGNITFLPDSVQVTGPESLLDTLGSYPTVYLQIEGINKDMEREVALLSPSETYSKVEPANVLMQIRTEQLTQKKVTVPVKISNPPQSAVHIVPREIEISFMIGLSEFTLAGPDDFSAQIVLPEELLPNQQFAVSIIKKPSHAIIQEVRPAYVDVFFDRQ